MVLVHHHIKYKEIHGVDEVVLMEKSEHKRLHNRLRREGKCNIPAPVLAQISARANNRRDEVRERKRVYDAKYRQDPAYKGRMREYMAEYMAKRYAEDPAYRERERERMAKWRTENKEQVRKYDVKRRTVFARLRPDIISSAMTPD